VTIHVPNPEALKAGIAYAEKHLNLWNQDEFIRYWDADDEPIDLPDAGDPPCGTTACLAGHILLAQGHSWAQIAWMDISGEALRILGYEEISDAGEDFFDTVFCHTHDDSGLLARTPEKFQLFKAYVTDRTGVEL
jgi:hypothetical protein